MQIFEKIRGVDLLLGISIIHAGYKEEKEGMHFTFTFF